MVNEKILAIRDRILETVACEKIILFGSYAYGEPRPESDYDLYVVLPDHSDKPIRIMQKIYRNLGDTGMVPVDIVANTKTRFEVRCQMPTLEKSVASKGVVLYERV